MSYGKNGKYELLLKSYLIFEIIRWTIPGKFLTIADQ